MSDSHNGHSTIDRLARTNFKIGMQKMASVVPSTLADYLRQNGITLPATFDQDMAHIFTVKCLDCNYYWPHILQTHRKSCTHSS
jgi:hypothetical protein